MSIFIEWIVNGLLGLSIAAFVINAYYRIIWDLNWNAKGRGVKIPERRFFYDARDIARFVSVARKENIQEESALAYYIGILKYPDVGFACGLSFVTVVLWYQIAVTPEPWPLLTGMCPASLVAFCTVLPNWFAITGICFAILYGVADVAEDYRLASILWHAGKSGDDENDPPGPASDDGPRVDRADASAANALTRIKIAALAASVVGMAIFIVLVVIQWAIVWGIERWYRGSGSDSSSGTGATGELALN